MRNIRITKKLIEDVCDAAVEKILGGRIKINSKMEKDVIGDMLYHMLYDDKTLKIMTSLPAGAFSKCSRIDIYFKGMHSSFAYSEPRIVFDCHYNRSLQVNDKGDMYSCLCEFHKEKKAIASEKSAIRNDISSIMKSVGTVKKLIQVWPESEELIRFVVDIDSDAVKPGTSLMVPTEELNKRLGLVKKC